MREAMTADGRVIAGPDSPDVATCPRCGAEVHKRKRTRMDRTTTWHYRHRDGTGKECRNRYRFGD